MPHEPNHQYKLQGMVEYTEPDVSILPEQQEERPRFNLFMPNYLSDMLKHGYNQSIQAHAVHLLGEAESPKEKEPDSFATGVAKAALPGPFRSVYETFDPTVADAYVPDILRKHEVSDDFSQYNEDMLFDIGSTLVSIVADIPAIAAATYFAKAPGPALSVTSARVSALGARLAPKVADGITKMQKAFKSKGVGDKTINKLSKSVYETLSNPNNIIQQGNTIGIYSATHNIMQQKVYNEDGASWQNKVDYLQAVDAGLAGWKGGAAFPIGASIGRPIVGGTLSKFAPGTKSAAVLQKVGGEAGDILGGGYAFVVPEYGIAPPTEALYHSIGVVAGLKGIHGTTTQIKDRVLNTNRAFNINLSDAEIAKAQDIIGVKIETEVKNSNSLYGKDGVEVRKIGVTAKNNAKYQEVKQDGTVGPTKYMDNNKFHKKYNIENIDALPADTMRKRIMELAEGLGAQSNKAKSELFYDGLPPRGLAETQTGLGRMSASKQYELFKDLKAQKIMTDYLRDISVSKLEPARLPMIGRIFDFLTLDVPFLPELAKRIRSNSARLNKRMDADPFARDMWRKFNSLPSKIQALQGRILTEAGVMDYLTNKKIDGTKLTGDILGNVVDNPVVNSIKGVYLSLGTKLREKGIIPKDVPLEPNYQPHYPRQSVMEALTRLQTQTANSTFKFEGKDTYLSFIKENNKSAKDNKKLSEAETKLVAKVLQNWLKNEKSVGAVKYVEQFVNKHTTTRGGTKEIQWDAAFKEINQNLNNVGSNPFHNFTKGRTTQIKWDVEKGGYDFDIFEPNAFKNLERYSKDAAEALTINELFGTNFEVYHKVIEGLEMSGKNQDVTALNDMYDATYNYRKFWTKPLNSKGWDVLRTTGKGLNNTIEALNNVFSGLLVSFGYGPIYNFTQPLISYNAALGYMPSVKSGLKKLTAEGRAEQKKILDETGMNLKGEQELFNLTHGEYNTQTSWHRRFAAWASKRSVMSLGIDVSTKSGLRRLSMEGSTQKVHESATLAGFEAINSLMITAKTGASIFERTFYSDKVKKKMEADTLGEKEVKGSDIVERRKAWAREKLLTDFNIVYSGTPLTRKQIGDGALFFADKTQLKRNVADEAFYMAHPTTRNFFRLKSFVIKQTKLTHDLVARQLKYGNALPLLRMAIAGAAGTQLIKFKRLLESTLAGEDVITRQDEDSLVDGFVAIGMGGYAVDLGTADDINKALAFQIEPLFWAVGTDIADDMWRYFTETRLLDMEGQLEAASGELSKYLGGPPRAIVRRVEGFKSKVDRLEYIKGLKEKEIMNLWLKAQEMQSESDKQKILDKATKKAREWNQAYGSYGVTIGDDYFSIYNMVAQKRIADIKKSVKEEREKERTKSK